MDAVTIIIVNYNGRHLLEDCLGSLRATEAAGEEIILVDNASTDGSAEFAKERFPEIRLLRLDKNTGFAEGNNIGAREASGEHLVFLNSDTFVKPGWLNPLISVMKSEPSVGAAGSKLLLFDNPSLINSAGACIISNGAAFDVGFMDNDSEKYNVPGFKGAVCAASMIVRKAEFLSLGGFDPDYFMYFEDVDLCWRYWLSGYKVKYVPESVVYHKFGGSTDNDRHSPFRVYYGCRNTLFNALKNLEAAGTARALCMNASLHLVNMFMFILRMRPSSAFAVLRAYGSFIRHLPGMLSKRRTVQAGRKISDGYFFTNALMVSIGDARRELKRLHKVFKNNKNTGNS